MFAFVCHGLLRFVRAWQSLCESSVLCCIRIRMFAWFVMTSCVLCALCACALYVNVPCPRSAHVPMHPACLQPHAFALFVFFFGLRACV